MFGLFKKVRIDHPDLGLLTRHGRDWEGVLKLLPNQSVPIELEGTKAAPHAEVISAALALPTRLPNLIPKIARELLEHLEPYRDAISDPKTGYAEMLSDPDAVEQIQMITSPEDAWEAAEICGVEIGLVDQKVRVLIKIGTIWDEEHTLGAYFDDWQFMELNGSV